MACKDCKAATETTGLWAIYNPACLWCGARLIQRLGKLARPPAELTARRKQVLTDWMAHGRAESELRALAKGPLPVEPKGFGVESEPPKKTKRR